MAATSIFFNGRLISVPGSYSEVDASGLEQVGLGATGIVAMLGEAVGGLPAGQILSADDFPRFNNPSQVRAEYISGDLREAGAMLFEPSADANITAGAVQVIGLRVNPATQGVATFSNAQGDALEVTSLDYGAHAGQINVAIGDGTLKGKQISIIFEDITEAGDDIGGDAMFNLSYDDLGTAGWDTMTAQVLAGGIVSCQATRTGITGNNGDEVNANGASAASAVSTSASDVGRVALYGLVGGVATREVLTLTGVTKVDGTVVWDAGEFHGFQSLSTPVGTISVGLPADPASTAWFVSTVPGADDCAAMYVGGGKVTVVAGGATTETIILVGKGAGGAAQVEKIVLTGAVAVESLLNYSELTGLALGQAIVGTTLVVSAEAARTSPAVESTMAKLDGYFNSRFLAGIGGFICTLVTARTALSPTALDPWPAAANIVEPLDPEFYADLYLLAEWITDNSQLVSAAAASGASGGMPDNTSAPVFLAGGGEGTSAFSDWQAALDLLKQVRVNTIVALTGDPAVHAAVDAHCALMGGIGRSERDAKLGALNAGLTDVPTKTEYKAQIVDINSRHVALTGQAVERYNTAGERQEFMPPFAACVAAGMQAGSPVGTALTYKYANVLGFRQSTTWNPADDAEEMIQAGACILENVDGVGRRWVRGITTHLTSSNLVFTEQSVNEAANFAAFNFRTNLEIVVGKPGFSGTINAAKGPSITILGLLVDAGTLVLWQSLTFALDADVLTVAVQMAPVIPINFVKSTLHLITVRQSA